MTRPNYEKERAEKFMRRAIELGRMGIELGDGGPFGAVIVRGDEILGEGWNRVVGTNDSTAHAEIVAIRDACSRAKDFNLQGCEIYSSGQPCPMCLSAIYWAHLDRVFYGFDVRDAAEIGFDDHFIYEQLLMPPQQRKIQQIQILGSEALGVLKIYASDPDRVRY